MDKIAARWPAKAVAQFLTFNYLPASHSGRLVLYFYFQHEFKRLLIEEVSKDLDAVKQSIPDDSKIVKKGVSGISVKIRPENE